MKITVTLKAYAVFDYDMGEGETYEQVIENCEKGDIQWDLDNALICAVNPDGSEGSDLYDHDY